jgi:hypothetical protein
MEYSEAYLMLDEIKRFIKGRQDVQDRRLKTFELMRDQMSDAYLACCVATNHIRVAERNDKCSKKK